MISHNQLTYLDDDDQHLFLSLIFVFFYLLIFSFLIMALSRNLRMEIVYYSTS